MSDDTKKIIQLTPANGHPRAEAKDPPTREEPRPVLLSQLGLPDQLPPMLADSGAQCVFRIHVKQGPPDDKGGCPVYAVFEVSTLWLGALKSEALQSILRAFDVAGLRAGLSPQQTRTMMLQYVANTPLPAPTPPEVTPEGTKPGVRYPPPVPS